LFLTFASRHLGSTVANVRNGPLASLKSHASGAALRPAGARNHRLRRDRVRRHQARQKAAAPRSLRLRMIPPVSKFPVSKFPVSKFRDSARSEFTPPRTNLIRAAGRAMHGVLHRMHGKHPTDLARRLQTPSAGQPLAPAEDRHRPNCQGRVNCGIRLQPGLRNGGIGRRAISHDVPP
jgi:hypothetical protein